MAPGKTNIRHLASTLSPSTYPWRNANSLELLINSTEFYPHMLQSIHNAETSIFLEMYLVASGKVANEFIDAFVAAANRGVRVFLLLDDFGSLGLRASDRKKLKHQNIDLTFYNPLRYGKLRRNLFRDHRKILIIDSSCAYIGGVGITDNYIDTKKNSPGWRDTVVAVHGECVLDWLDVFRRVWSFYAKTPLFIPSRVHITSQTDTPCRVNCTIGSEKQGIKRSLVKRIKTSERCCWIATAYFVPSFKVRRALIRAAKRGVDVRILTPGPKTDHPAIRHAGRRFYRRLLNAGVKIYEYQPRFMHQKVLLCDSWASVGSSNIDRWNFRWNLEANQEVEEQDFVNAIVKMFEADFSESLLCSIGSWEKRSRYERLLEKFWGLVDRYIDRWLQ